MDNNKAAGVGPNPPCPEDALAEHVTGEEGDAQAMDVDQAQALVDDTPATEEPPTQLKRLSDISASTSIASATVSKVKKPRRSKNDPLTQDDIDKVTAAYKRNGSLKAFRLASLRYLYDVLNSNKLDPEKKTREQLIVSISVLKVSFANDP